MNPITNCGDNGVYELDSGEGLTADPVVYAGVVYFYDMGAERGPV